MAEVNQGWRTGAGKVVAVDELETLASDWWYKRFNCCPYDDVHALVVLLRKVQKGQADRDSAAIKVRDEMRDAEVKRVVEEVKGALGDKWGICDELKRRLGLED